MQGYELSWQSTSDNEEADSGEAGPEGPTVLPFNNTCNHLVFQADEILLNLETLMMPTNSTGFWLDYWVSYDGQPGYIPSQELCMSSTFQKRYLSTWRGLVSFDKGSTEFEDDWSGSPYDSGTWPVRDYWGVPPNGRVEWVIVPPDSRAKSVQVFPPELDLEKDRDFMKIYSCRQGNCTQMYRTMTGTVNSRNLYCQMNQNADEIRIEVQYDSIYNFASTVKYIGWLWSSETLDETTSGECPDIAYAQQSGTASFDLPAALSLPVPQTRVTWIFRPGAGTKSITIDFTQFSPFWVLDVLFLWDCIDDVCQKIGYVPGFEYDQTAVRGCVNFDSAGKLMSPFECLNSYCFQGGHRGCYSPPPQPCKMTFPTEELRVTFFFGSQWLYMDSLAQTVRPLKAVYNSSNTSAPVAVMGGDCRLKFDQAEHVLTEASGTFEFDAAEFTKKASQPFTTVMGYAIKAGRIRWVIRPQQPTKSITVSFKSIDLSPANKMDLLYVLPDCQPLMTAWTEGIISWSSYKARLLNGYGQETFLALSQFKQNALLLSWICSEDLQTQAQTIRSCSKGSQHLTLPPLMLVAKKQHGFQTV